MAATDQTRTEAEQRKITESDAIPEADTEKLLKFSNAASAEIPYPEFTHDGEKVELADCTLRNYLIRLRLDYYEADDPIQLTDTTAETINERNTELDKDQSRGTTRQGQMALRQFFRFHDGLGIDAGDISMFSTEDTAAVDPDKVLTFEEIERLRAEIKNTNSPVRDLAWFEIFVNTGQRISAVLTLKTEDIRAHEKPGYIKLNDDEGDLKGADDRGLRRPLLKGRKAVRELVDKRERANDDNPYLFVGDSNYNTTDEHGHYNPDSLRGVLRRAAKRADIDPGRCKPHFLRHYWVTNMKLNQDLDWDEICALGGWVKDSDTPKMVYNHIDENEYHESVEEKLGLRESSESDSVKTAPCDICGEIVKPQAWDECPNCHEPIGMDGEGNRDLMGDLVESAAQAEGDAADGAVALKGELQEYPSLKEEIKAELKAEMRAEMMDD